MTDWKLDYVNVALNELLTVRSDVSPQTDGVRLVRFLDYQAYDAPNNLAELPSPAVLGDYTYWSYISHKARLLDACQTSFLPALELGARDFLSEEIKRFLDLQARRRLDLLRLALIAFRLDNDHYPTALDQLVPKYATAGMLVDPFTRALFEYRPKGFDLPAATERTDQRRDFIPPHTPLVWSAGPMFVEPREKWAIFTRQESGEVTVEWAETEYRAQAIRDSESSEIVNVMKLTPIFWQGAGLEGALLRLPPIEDGR